MRERESFSKRRGEDQRDERIAEEAKSKGRLRGIKRACN